MKYFTHLDLNWKPVSEKLKQFVLDNKELVGYYNSGWKRVDLSYFKYMLPDIIKMLKPLDVLPVNIAFVIDYDDTKTIIHRDYTEHNARRIVLPVMNCENTITKFYKSDIIPELNTQTNGAMYYTGVDMSLCKVVDEYCLKGPVAIRPKELHCIFPNNNMAPRISCPINVNKDLDYLFE